MVELNPRECHNFNELHKLSHVQIVRSLINQGYKITSVVDHLPEPIIFFIYTGSNEAPCGDVYILTTESKDAVKEAKKHCC